MSDPGELTGYPKPAGNWCALKSSVKHMAKSRAPVKSFRTLLHVNQPDGFDCPGCAWPEPHEGAGKFEFCENGVKAVAWEATSKRVTPEFFAQNSVAFLRQQSDLWLESQGRLTEPMRYNRATDHYEPVTWGEAFKLIGDTLRSLPSPDEAEFYTSGRTSNEAAFLYQLLGRMYGTNNFPDCSNMCHESSGVAMGEVLGVGKGTVTLEDFDHADCIFVIGQNPGTNHPRMLTELEKAAKRGAKIVTINPLKEPGLVRFIHPQHAGPMLTGRATDITTLYLQPKVSGDMAVLKGIIKHVLEQPECLDRDFIGEFTDGFSAFAADIAAESWEAIEQHGGLSREQLKEAAEIYMKADRVIACWAMGITQQKHAVPVIQMVVNLLLLRGNMGREGAGACPVRGHSNVQGDRTMGITHHPKPEFLKKLGQVFGFTPPKNGGHDTVAAIRAMDEGTAKVFISMGGNFAAATPDSDHTAAALEKCLLTAHVATKLNRSHTVCGRDALILPCLGRTEIDRQAGGPQRVTVEDSMSQVHASEGSNTPASPHLLSEPAIVAGIANATLGVDWFPLIADYSRIREKIAEVLPAFTGFNDRIKTPGGFYLGNDAHERTFNTETGKARFTVHRIADLTLPPGQLRLMTLRSHDQYNTTVYDLNDRYRGIKGTRRIVLLNPADIAAAGLKAGDTVEITSHFADGKKRSVAGFQIVAYDIPQGSAAGYFPELNPLVSVDSFADRSFTPTSKFIPITLSASHH